MTIVIIALFHIAQDILVGNVIAFRYQLVKATLCAVLGTGGKENLNIRKRQYDRADIAAIHNHVFAASRILLQIKQEATNRRQRRDRRLP